jgi:hypothetical protein
VERQWCGRYGKIDNCQVATFLAYESGGEFVLIDRQLYLQQSWIDPPIRCRNAGVPDKLIVMNSRHTQAIEMICGRGKKCPHQWIAGDDEIGKVPWFRRYLRDLKEPYMLVVPSTILMTALTNPTIISESHCEASNRLFISVRTWAKRLPANR